MSSDDAEFFGVFPIDPSRPAAELSASLRFRLSNPTERQLTIAELMRGRLGGQADYADRVVIGPVELIVRDVGDDGAVIAAGLSLEPDANRPSIPVFLSLAEVIAYAPAALARSPRRNDRASGNASVTQPWPI